MRFVSFISSRKANIKNESSSFMWVYFSNQQIYYSRQETCIYLNKINKFEKSNCANKYQSLCKFSIKGCKVSELKPHVPNAYFRNCKVSSSPPLKIIVECKEGFIHQNGSNIVKCLFNGKWSHYPKCLPGCVPPKLSNNSFLLQPKEFYSVGEVAYLMCKKNFITFKVYPIAYIATRCLNTCEWSDSLSDCYPINKLLYHYNFEVNRYIDIRISIGDDVKLSICNGTTGKAMENDSEIIWFKDQVPWTSKEFLKVSDDFALTLLNYTYNDSGIYTCLIKNKTTESVINFCSYHVGLSRICPENKNIKNTAVIFPENTNQIIRCSDDAIIYKPKWLHNGQPLLGNERKMPIADGSLYIKNISIHDEGVYLCAYEDKNVCISKFLVTISIKQKIVCGKVSENSTKKSVRPWMATLWNDGEIFPFCYATLIDSKWLVTSATCLFGIHRKRIPGFTVKLGAKSESFDQATTYKVSKVKLHPRYSKRLSFYDAALIKLETSVIYTNDVYPICFLGSNYSKNDFCDEPEIGITTGWGPLGTVEEMTDWKWRSELLTVREYATCKDSVRHQFPDYMFCAEGEKTNPFNLFDNAFEDRFAGDSGSSFEIEWKKQWYLWGVLSWGDRGYGAGDFDYYSKIMHFESWIESTINAQ